MVYIILTLYQKSLVININKYYNKFIIIFKKNGN